MGSVVGVRLGVGEAMIPEVGVGVAKSMAVESPAAG